MSDRPGRSGHHDPDQDPDDTGDDDIAELVRGALQQEADMVEPQDRHEQVRDAVSARRSPTWAPWAAAAAAVALVAGLAIGLNGRGEDAVPVAQSDPTPTSEASEASENEPKPSASAEAETQTTDTSTEPVPSTAPAAAGDVVVPVYYVGGRSRPVLYREFAEVPVTGDSAAARATAALQAMLTQAPSDPDYRTPWRPSGVGVSLDDDGTTVTLESSAFADSSVDAELAEIAVQQLVYTVTAALGDTTPVSVLVDDDPDYRAWGAVALGAPIDRAPMAQVQATTWLLSPGQGATVDAGTVTVTGFGTAVEGQATWEVVTDRGQIIRSGAVTTGANGVFADFSFDVDLDPGSYTITVYQEDLSDGESPEGGRILPDSKAITVR